MRVLHSHHILPLFVWSADAKASADQTRKTGRPATDVASSVRLGAAVPQLGFSSLAQLPELCASLPPRSAAPQQVAQQPVSKRNSASLHGRHHAPGLQNGMKALAQSCSWCSAHWSQLAE